MEEKGEKGRKKERKIVFGFFVDWPKCGVLFWRSLGIS
jgi:hypothetical protein